MKKRVAKKTAAARKRIVEERQLAITEQNMDRFVGRKLDILIEEQFENAGPDDADREDREALWLGRLYCQAPEVDGATVIAGGSGADTAALKPGMLVSGTIIARRGFDLEARVSLRVTDNPAK